jgi:hypothetical protein
VFTNDKMTKSILFIATGCRPWPVADIWSVTAARAVPIEQRDAFLRNVAEALKQRNHFDDVDVDVTAGARSKT